MRTTDEDYFENLRIKDSTLLFFVFSPAPLNACPVEFRFADPLWGIQPGEPI